ncbi:GDSL-type esterase/lipase family protein [Clostridium sp. AL.422]|nr:MULTISPECIES: GDSL-type esterase/lipase family protein [unclassified Clostridium]MDV4149529.1 GDSL-type esterase/lipase family protein [Clostridium sp. AL.422]
MNILNHNNFIFIGDSLTFGYGVNKNKCWIEILRDSILSSSINLNIINKGINGNTTTDMLNRFTEDVIKLNPYTVFIMGGTNDLLSNRHLSLILDNIELMIKEAQTKTNNIIIGIPPRIVKEDAYRLFMPSSTYDYCENTLPILRDKLIKLCESYKVKYIDFYNLTANLNQKEIYLDGIHLNENGHKILFESFIKMLDLDINK